MVFYLMLQNNVNLSSLLVSVQTVLMKRIELKCVLAADRKSGFGTLRVVVS